VHGLSSTEWSWSIAAEEFHGDASASFGTMLRDELDYTPLYVRYNSGRHISDNGQALSLLLANLVTAYPCAVDEIVLIGHSMGGLVVRSAAHYGHTAGEDWIGKLKAVFCIGSPTLGAPLEQAAGLLGGILSAVDLVGTQVPAQLLNSRSAGIKDLRHGYTVDEEWRENDQDDPLANHRRAMPLVDGVGYYFVVATVTENPSHPVGLLFGDLLVRLPSASGQAAKPERRVEFHAGHLLNGINHFHLANHPDVYAMIRDVLTN
jgi:pimeloyl-ACP methyl ester carboxylesterase